MGKPALPYASVMLTRSYCSGGTARRERLIVRRRGPETKPCALPATAAGHPDDAGQDTAPDAGSRRRCAGAGRPAGASRRRALTVQPPKPPRSEGQEQVCLIGGCLALLAVRAAVCRCSERRDPMGVRLVSVHRLSMVSAGRSRRLTSRRIDRCADLFSHRISITGQPQPSCAGGFAWRCSCLRSGGEIRGKRLRNTQICALNA